MTGFGRAERSARGVSVTLQVSSVNRKNLEVVCSLPKEFQQLERTVVERSRSRAGRGRFQYSVDIRDERSEAAGLPSDSQIESALKRIKAVVERNGGEYSIDANSIIALANLLEGETESLLEDVVESLLMECVDTAMSALIAMREQEGVALKADLKNRRETMAAALQSIKAIAPEMVGKYRETLHSRLEQAGLDLNVDDERVLKEIALFADRSDLSEEITRLESHFDQFADLLEKDEPVGRSLEFLLQEIAREINTTGSKSCSIEISKRTLAMKNELERIREQVANVE